MFPKIASSFPVRRIRQTNSAAIQISASRKTLIVTAGYLAEAAQIFRIT